MTRAHELPVLPQARRAIGEPLPRLGLQRLLQGRGQYLDDLAPPRLAHAVMVRSPYAHAAIRAIDGAEAAAMPGVLAVMTGEDVARWCTPWVGTLETMKGMRSPPQHALAIGRACWHGEPVAMVVAHTRAQAEDAAERVLVEWEELPVVLGEREALADGAPRLHESLEVPEGAPANLCFALEVGNASGDFESAAANAAAVVQARIRTGRHTHVPLEPRSLLADFDPAARRLRVWHGSQAPHMMQSLIARHFRLPEAQVQVIVPDVGGSFGLKIQVFGDEMAAIAASMALGRPVKFVADRVESFTADLHARGHDIDARMALAADGRLLAFEVDDYQSFGPYGSYPRAGVGEGRQVISLAGAPYVNPHYRGRLRVAFQNKGMVGPYRSVGHPVACLVTEVLLEQAARALGLDPLDVRARNYLPDDAYPARLASGVVAERLSQHAALARLREMVDVPALREEQARLRAHGVHRGLGFASFVEMTNPGGTVYGAGGAPIAAMDACTLRLSAGGSVTCALGLAETGQGTAMMAAQVAASELGVPVESVRVVLGDTDAVPYGGGNYGSRGTGVGGEAVLLAARALRASLLEFAARLLGTDAALLDLRDGHVCQRDDGVSRMTLEALARIGCFRSDLWPAGYTPELAVTRSYAQRDYNSVLSNGIQASWVEVDAETGIVRLLGHWVVEDCGTIVNPLLVDEQIRGGVVQGLGAALYEECLYSETGQLVNCSLADYLVPMAGEMPDIAVAHVETPTRTSQLGAKGAGEAGVAGASAAVLNAVNDALAPLGGFLATIPITPERVLRALGRID